MSNELQNKLDAILIDKKLNITPGNLKAGKTCLGVNGMFDFVNEEEYPTYEKLSNKILGKIQIPEEYTLLDYIESTGTQYINIGELENRSDASIEVTGKFTEIENGKHLEGIFKGSNSTGMVKAALNFGYDYNPDIDSTVYLYTPVDYVTNIKTTYIQADTNIHKFSLLCYNMLIEELMGEGHSKGFYLDGVYIDSGANTSIGGIANYFGPFYIFAHEDNGAIHTNKFRVYNYKIWRRSFLNYDLYPVKRNSDGVIGLLNISNEDSDLYHQFYTNQGTGEFLYKEL